MKMLYRLHNGVIQMQTHDGEWITSRHDSTPLEDIKFVKDVNIEVYKLLCQKHNIPEE